MRILYECSNLAILEDNDNFIVHVLDNYRIVKEVKTHKDNLIPTIKKEFKDDINIQKIIFKELNANPKNHESDIDKIKKVFSKVTKTLRTCMW